MIDRHLGIVWKRVPYVFTREISNDYITAR